MIAETLAPIGRFEEIGKRSVWSFARAAAAVPSAYSVLDMALDVPADPDWYSAEVLQVLARRLEAVVVHGLPLRSFGIEREARDAFRFLSGGANLGKVVITIPVRLGAPSSLAVAFAPLCELLDAHVSDAVRALEDLPQVTDAHEVLERAVRHDIARALSGLDPSAIPKWHHRLLYEWCAAIEPPTEPASYEDVLAVSPRLWPEVGLTQRCASQLAAALLGTAAYQELLFPGGSMELTLPVYEDAVNARFYNECVVAAVDSIIASLPAGRFLSVVEVGAGTGGTASSVLPRLRRVCEQYMFTDVSEVFLNQAQRRFAEYAGFMRFELLNIDADSRLQGFASGSFDLAIATNVLHATPFIRNTLRNCRRLLCDGGFLLLNELLRTNGFLQTTFGLTDGWWMFASDPERTNQPSPLLSWEHWRQILAASGFASSHCMRGDGLLLGAVGDEAPVENGREGAVLYGYAIQAGHVRNFASCSNSL